MKRRQFIFRSAQAMALLHPILSMRIASAQEGMNKRAIFWMHCNGYSRASDMFPSEEGKIFSLPPSLTALEDLKNDLVIVDGIRIIDSGAKKPKSNNHVCSVGKLFTAKDVIVLPDASGAPGGPSVDQVIAERLKMKTAQFHVHHEPMTHMRARPFARARNEFKGPIVDPQVMWDLLFKGQTPPDNQNEAKKAQRLSYLNSKKSILDDLTGELTRFRRELAGDAEKLKLDIHEDAIRRAELSIAEDIKATKEEAAPPALCQFPERPIDSDSVPIRAKAHMDLLFAALACNRIQIGGITWGFSGYHWRYKWVKGTDIENYHEEVAHRNLRDQWILGQQWDWGQLGGLARRLKETPEGAGNMLDSTLILGMGHFGGHHGIERVPTVIMGGKSGGLETGRSIKLKTQVNNDKLLTSVARYMGVNLSGIGNNPKCGPLDEL